MTTPPLSAETIATLRAVIDRLIPRDDFPGATGAGVDGYILRQLAGDAASDQPLIAAGLATIESTAVDANVANFASLPETEQDALLQRVEVESPSFFNRLLELCAEGYYADPEQGGNRDEVSWRMLGYSRRTPDHPAAL